MGIDARQAIIGKVPQQAELANVSAQRRIKVVKDPENVGVRRSQKIKYPNSMLKGYKY